MHIHVITYFSNLYSFFHYTQFQGVINIDGDTCTLHFDICNKNLQQYIYLDYISWFMKSVKMIDMNFLIST